MKKRIFNKRGMTYVEMLVALAVLALIVVSFTPMLLYSYETLYEAGVKTENVYNSKQEIEEGLAVRNSTRVGNVGMTFVMNTEKLFENINVSGRKVVSSLQDKLETIFYGARARVDIVTPKVVYDDTLTHDVIVQTTGIEFKKVYSYLDYPGNIENLPQDTIVIAAYIPNKNKGASNSTTDDSLVYQSNPATLKIGETNAKKGRIAFTVGGADFTQSPIKIIIYYKNERDILKECADYLYIEPATILFGGTTNNGADYYTTAGIQNKDTSSDSTNQSTIYKLEVMGRTMRTENSSYLKTYYGSPSNKNVIIRDISWVDTDETLGLKPYYVMVGTNGSIYRMYNYTSHTTDIYKLSNGITSRKNDGSYSADNLTPWDNVYQIADGSRVYSSLWSGDSSHVFDFSTWSKSTNYGLDEEEGNDNCWLTAKQELFKAGTSIGGFIPITSDKYINTKYGDEKYNLFGMQAKFSYYFNGYRVGFNYAYQKARNMSYIITEYGAPLRVFGHLKEENDYDGFTRSWYDSSRTVTLGWKKNTSDPNKIAIFTGSSGAGGYAWRHSETVFSSIRFMHFGSYNPNSTSSVDYTLVDFMRTDGEATDDREQARQITNGYDSLHGRESEINITDAVYIPSTDTTTGAMFYVGSVHAYMNVSQKDNINSTANRSLKVDNRAENKDWDELEVVPHAAITDYVVFGNNDGTGTYVHKYSSNTVGRHYVNKNFLGTETGVESSKSWGSGAATADKKAKMGSTSGSALYGNDRRDFYVARSGDSWKSMYMSDVLFTMGYSSNREKVFTNVTYNGIEDRYRSYEPYYFASHYGEGGTDAEGVPSHTPNRATTTDATNRNIYNNDYYNVWFPGEMYNLSKIASKDGVTVAVGYAVAGSAYQWINPSVTSNTSTALGGIYNDGVLAAMIEGTQSEFTNLLYFKDNATFNSTYLTSGYSGSSTYSTAFGTYGTHDRDSVQFTAVDIATESTATSETTENKTYYAYYGDNKGRLFRSIVANASVTRGEQKVDEYGNKYYEMIQSTSLVNYIADTTFAGTVTPPSRMEEIKIGTTPVSTYFSRITAIDAKDDMIVVTGTPQSGVAIGVLVGTRDENNNWTWKRIQFGDFQGLEINASKIVGGYYYFGGSWFFAGVNLETLKNADPGAKLNVVPEQSTNKNDVIYVNISDTIYAMDGREIV